jgi:hypothetical protein
VLHASALHQNATAGQARQVNSGAAAEVRRMIQFGDDTKIIVTIALDRLKGGANERIGDYRREAAARAGAA